MAVAGELALLPILNPVRVARMDGNSVRDHQQRLHRQPRVRRVLPKINKPRFSYGPGGFPSHQNHKGRTIDLFA